VRSRNIEGYIAMMMDLPSLSALQALLQALIERTAGAEE
jgi:chemotaxis protein CheC